MPKERNMKSIAFILVCFLGLLSGCENTYVQPKYELWKPSVDHEVYLANLSSLQLSMRVSSYENEIHQNSPEEIREQLSEFRKSFFRMNQKLKEKNYDTIAGNPDLLKRFNKVNDRMKEIEDSIALCERKAKISEERFLVDRQKNILKKEKYLEHLLKGILATGISEGHIYSDDTVVIYLDSIKVRIDSVCLQIRAYLVKPSEYDNIYMGHCGTNISLYNTRGENLGSPIDINFLEKYQTGGVIINLTFEDKIPLGDGILKLLIEKSTFYNN